jgi:heterodisulfide reductase subunit A
LGEVLKEAGFDSGRLRVEWISAAEGEKFANTIEDFVDYLKAIGPIGSELEEADR